MTEGTSRAQVDVVRREFIRRAALGGAALLTGSAVGAALQACGQPSTSGTRTGGTISFALSTEPKVLNPPIHTLLIESTVMSLLFPGLIRSNSTGGFDPEL